MNLKKKLRKFFTLTRTANGGFTLVELIVVIAILAILAGVGTVGYSGYIKSSNKNADKVLVGNIMRAIETGTNSYAFVGDDSFKMGQLSYPVGFVVLTPNEEARIVISTTETYPATEDACQFVTIENIVKIENKTDWICQKHTAEPYVQVTNLGTVSYCVSHGPEAQVQALSGTYILGYEHEAGPGDCGNNCSNGCAKFEAIYGTYTSGAKTVTNLDALYVPSANDGTKCEAAYANQHGGFGTPSTDFAGAGNMLYDSIVAAFGDLSDLKLSYDGWKSDEGVSYATFYASAPALMEDMERLAGLLAAGSQLSYEKLGLTQKYGNGEEVLTKVSENIATSKTEEEWMEAWRLAADKTWDGWGFNLSGRENYSAARMAYNNAFASYLEAIDSRFAAGGEYNSYLTNIREFYSQEIAGVGLPGLVNTSAFATTDKLKNKINNDEVFNLIAAKYEEYKDSDACEENGRLVYDVLVSFNETSDVANAYKEMNGGTIYDYYNSYVDEIALLYQEAQKTAKDGIVIIVTIEEGIVKCVVSPGVANPRNN